jgi:putative ABC transport system substrate-binding protein
VNFKRRLALGLAAWPLVAAAQAVRVRRIGVLMPFASNDAESQLQMKVLEQGLQELGWSAGRNLQIDYRWTGGDATRMPILAKELADSSPDLIVARGTPVVLALLRQTRAIPIVFVSVSDPVGDRLVASLPRPGGNVTGFTNFEASMGGKWVEMLKELAPGVARAAFLFNPQTAPGGGTFFLGSFEAGARRLGVEPVVLRAGGAAEIEAALSALGEHAGSGLIVMPDVSMLAHRELITTLAARHRIPAVYPFRYYAALGGLMSYGTDITDLYHRAAPYLDRILKGEKPADLPVQAPTKFELVINLNSAKALRLAVPRTLLVRADEVIE